MVITLKVRKVKYAAIKREPAERRTLNDASVPRLGEDRTRQGVPATYVRLAPPLFSSVRYETASSGLSAAVPEAGISDVLDLHCGCIVSIGLIVRQRVPAFRLVLWGRSAHSPGLLVQEGWFGRHAAVIPSSPHTHCPHAATISLFSTHCPHAAAISLSLIHI